MYDGIEEGEAMAESQKAAVSVYVKDCFYWNPRNK